MARTRDRTRGRSGGGRTGKWLVSVFVFVLVAGLVACANEGSDDEPAPTGGPYDASAELRPDLLELEPDEVRPGATIRMHYPEETPRGVGYVLEEEVEGTWQLRYFLTAAEHSGASPSWSNVRGGNGPVWPDVGVTGPGPNWIQIPHRAEPGTYRVCTANAGDEFCARLQLID